MAVFSRLDPEPLFLRMAQTKAHRAGHDKIFAGEKSKAALQKGGGGTVRGSDRNPTRKAPPVSAARRRPRRIFGKGEETNEKPKPGAANSERSGKTAATKYGHRQRRRPGGLSGSCPGNKAATGSAGDRKDGFLRSSEIFEAAGSVLSHRRRRVDTLPSPICGKSRAQRPDQQSRTL